MKISILTSVLALGMLASGAAFAQTAPATPAATPAKPAAAAPAKAASPDAAAKAAKSADCSKQADAKGLHGKDRKKFREECKKAM